jgi:hypothetical protein
MKEKLINDLKNTKNTSHYLRIIACTYVAYTCGKVCVEYFRDGDVQPVLLILSAILAILAIGIVAISLWAVLKGYSVEYNGTPPWATAADDNESEPSPEEPGADAAAEIDEDGGAAVDAPAESDNNDAGDSQ